MGEYYRDDLRGLTFAEGWRLTRSWTVLIAWGSKILRIPFPSSTFIKFPFRMVDQEIGIADCSAESRAFLDPSLEQLRGMGFEAPFIFTLKDSLTVNDMVLAAARHSSGDSFAVVTHCRAGGANGTVTQGVSFVTARTNGTTVSTTSLPHHLNGPPGNDSLHLPMSGIGNLWEAHEQRKNAVLNSGLALKLQDRDSVIEQLELNERNSFEFHRKRGFYVLAKPTEIENARKIMEASVGRHDFSEVRGQPEMEDSKMVELVPGSATVPPPPPRAVSNEDAVVLEHLRQLQMKKSGSWTSALLILVVSIGLFAGLGAARWDWKFALFLIPILFFHELGHYVAMKGFGYRDLKMFFIPLFGAAVSGTHYSVAGWKKVIVSLAGPVPGILVGGAAAVAGVVMQIDWLIDLSFLAIFINAFNLLPVLPLDGGHVLRAILFCRHPMLNAGFQLIAGLSLMALDHYLEARLLFFLGIMMLVGIPASYKLAKVAGELRSKALDLEPVDDAGVPVSTAQSILSVLRREYPKGQTPKSMAQLTLSVFEDLNARPPGWFASLTLLAVHGGFVAMAVVFASICVVAQTGGLNLFGGFGLGEPEHQYQCHSTVVWEGESYDPVSDEESATLVARFVDLESAKSAFDRYSAELPETTAAVMFGQTLLIHTVGTDADGQSRLFDSLDTEAEEVSADSSESNVPVTITATSPTPEAAESALLVLRKQSALYGGLLPVWLPEDPRTEEEVRRHDVARSTYVALQETGSGVFTNETYSALQEEHGKALRKGQSGRLRELEKQQTELVKTLRDAEIEAFKAANDGEYVQEVIDLYLEMEDDEEYGDAYAQAHDRLLTLMGKIEEESTSPEMKAASLYVMFGGYPSLEEQKITIGYASFESPVHGLPALVNWLCDQGFEDIKYEHHHVGFVDDEDLW